MADPLGLIGAQGNGGVSPINPVGRAQGANKQHEGPGFKDVMLENLKQVNALQQDATHAIEDLQTGQRDDVETVLMATEKADAAFRMLLAVRNKVLDAYEEVKQTSV
ncbi:MAG: flagellar hook-basal body complex protein FliE [Phycisphaerales bacterium]